MRGMVMFGKGGDDKWKRKHDELRRELRQQELEWGEIEALLQRAVTRVCIASAGLDPRMESALNRVRDAVRGQIDRRKLEHGLGELAEVVKQLEASPAQAATPKAGHVPAPLSDLLISILERLEFDESARHGFLETIDYLSRFPDRHQEIRSRVIELLNANLRRGSAADAATPAQPAANNDNTVPAVDQANRAAMIALLERLKLREDAQRSILAAWSPAGLDAALEELARQLQPRLAEPTPSEASDRSEPGEASTAGADSLRRILLSLVRRIGRIQGLEQATERLRKRLDQPVDDPEWPAILQSLTDALAEVMNRIRAQKAELESFITQVGQQLGEFERFVRGSQQDLDSARSGRQRLSSELGNEMQAMRASMDGATDIAELKHSVLGSLAKIAEQLNAFREHEESRIAVAEQRNHDLIRQMDELRFEAQRLREQNDEQREQLMLDPLTKVNSRFAYEKRVEEEFSRWRRYHQPLSYAIWDIDRFKSINDAYGHKAGDKLLQMVARILARNTRKSDFLARIGGEEFVLLLPGTRALDAEVIANKLRHIVADTDFHYKQKRRQITLSCGITEFREGDSIDAVYQRADAALYQAKNGGRNRCEAA